MKIHTPRNIRSALVFVFAVMGACVAINPPLHASEVQVGRYSALRAMPTVAQSDLLSTIITVRFPERIQTLGEAVHYLLQRSGYRISVITIGALTILRGQIDGNLSERIGQWFESLRTDHSSMNQELSGLVNTVSAIHESIADLRNGNEDLKQRIDAAQSRLQVIAKDVRGLKIAAKKQVAKRQKSAAEKPPFHIDVIDLWDDAVYVAISQDGRVTFLREGEQRSGWHVTHIDRAKGQVAFRGPAGQDYSASLRR